MQRLCLAVSLAAVVFASAIAQAEPAPAQGNTLTLEKIMADPDWIGAPVRDAYWSADGRAVYYSTKRSGAPINDLHRIDLADGKTSMIDGAAMANSDAEAIYDVGGTRAAFVRNGDVFVRDLPSARLIQITRGAQVHAAVQFSADARLLSYRDGADWFVHDLASGVTSPAATLKLEKDPNAAPKSDDLRDMQLRTFSTLRKLHDDRDAIRKHAEELRKADPTRDAAPFYLGDDIRIIGSALSPDAHWLLVVTGAKSEDKGREGKLTRYVTESGYEEFETERSRVGRNPPATQALLLLDLVAHHTYPLALDALPGIHDDPLKAIRDENATLLAAHKRDATDAGNMPNADQRSDKSASTTKSAASKSDEQHPKLRAVRILSDAEDGGGGGVAFSRDGSALAIQVRAIDNKDRWIASVDFSRHVLVSQHRLSDAAWIGWNFNEFGWLNDNRTLWLASEESGYAHLYTLVPGNKARALTQGSFEVSQPALSADGRWFYARSNALAPYSYDVYRVAVEGGKLERVTQYQGVERFALSHDGRQLLVSHSSSYVPTQLAVVNSDGSGAPRELTDTRTTDFKALSWVAPEIVQVPSSHFKGSIYAKLYKPANVDKSTTADLTKRPAVLFVHGAGYLQNVHLSYPAYFREQMFHNLVLQHGYVVLDMDYRASEGYGRAWRTAIYRQMGHPELEDLLDGKKYLVDTRNVDPNKVGIYGGSYGGFMTLMALFRAPGEFAAGAALRPVTDWMQYNHEYTGDILNDPQVDPIAYLRSSPIEFAAGLKDPLLICHGMIDDNVLFEDSIRLYARLIELHKDNFTISPYPLDRHGFSNADSWLDEYKRIYRLFEANLK